tara:strand:- start:102 stop:632 length:531 start_codon:yes stop_codon:yes gene_type:complete
MAGKTNGKELLNKTLLFILKLLNENNINNWFIAYGTLLGIIREDSCIQGDDDIDIVMDKNNYDILKQLLMENGFEMEYGHTIGKSRDIIKTKDNEKYCTIDFYMAAVDSIGNFDDRWENVVWSKCYDDNKKLIHRIWKGTDLYLPFNYETKIINRYGESWKVPQNTKGPNPKKRII